MRSAGLVPSIEMFNALLTEALKADVDWWYILPEMELDKVKPESSTCSLLLRSSVTVPRQRQHLSKVAGVFEGLGKDAADIFGLFLETCLRFNRADLLRHCLKRQRDSSPLPVRDSITYAHLIRAYGVLEDVDGAWHAWNEMVSRNMIPLKVTVGCMVQALVTNKHVEAGYGLVRELNDDPRTGHLATAVTYNSLLKGFVVQKLFDRAWSVYIEMCDRSLVLTVMTFNTLIDACARCGHMDRIEGILNAMKEHGVEADAITYNTVIKGLCHDGRLEEALTMRTKLRQSKKHSVDGHAYAALLDGCSRLRKWELGFELFDEMQADNVLPNNVTLTALMRMAGCSRKPWALERALNLCDTVARNHRIQLNGFVYKNMVIACVTHGERVRALKVIGQAASARVLMDASTYEPLLLALASERKTLGDAATLLSLVCGLRVPRSDVHVLLGDAPMDALRAHDGFGAKSVEKVLLAMATFDREQAVHLARRLERETALRLDRRVKLQLASARGGQVP
jgi:pentatricopeptide repeat protein